MYDLRSPLLFSLIGLLVACDGTSRHEATARVHDETSPSSAVASADSPAFAADAKADKAEAEAAPMPAMAEADKRLGRTREDDGIRSPLPGARAGLLTAGRWSDRDHWSYWEGLRASGSTYQQILAPWNLDPRQRVAVTLRGRSYEPIDTQVILQDPSGRSLWRGRTDNRGRVDLYLPPHTSGQLVVRAPDGSVLATREVEANEEHELRIDGDMAVVPVVDLMFVVDTTGSMGDELEFLKTELADIVARVKRDSAQELAIRTSVNFYRDRGDAYVVRSHPFTLDLDTSLSYLRVEQAGGGGDFPEALDAALANGVREHRWSDSAVARLMFVITDAPPHAGHQIGQGLQDTVNLAADKGIRIVPLAASGVDKSAEFMLRHLAVRTGGTYLFLTDHSGIGNAHLEPTIGPHVVKPLNDLMVEVIGEYTQTHDSLVVATHLDHGAQSSRFGGHAASIHRPRETSWGLVGAIVGLLLIPMALAGWWWRRRTHMPTPTPDARIARARKLVDELTRLAKTSDNEEARSWSPQVKEVAEGIEQLARQREAIDASLRSAGASLGDEHGEGMRGQLRAEVATRRQSIDAEIDAGLLSIEAAYLHVIGGVGQRTTAQANLDAAREALQTRLEVERELR